MTAPVPAPDRDREQTCVHCGVEVRVVNWALGPELMHSPYPHHTRDAYRNCRLTVATLADVRCCARCGDVVQYLSSDDLCDACCDEADGAEDR